MPEEIEVHDMQVWDTEHPKKVIPLIPIEIRIKRGVTLPRLKQYPLSEQAIKGLQPLVMKYLENGLLEPCISDCNTPIMAVPKPKQKKEEQTTYRFIHNLKAINSIVEPMQVTVANPYTILNGVTPEAEWFTVVDLKDAFFSVPINEDSRNLFSFEWTDEKTKRTSLLRLGSFATGVHTLPYNICPGAGGTPGPNKIRE